MRKRNRDNVKAKKNYTGPWTVIFKCGKRAFVSWASSAEIGAIAKKLHDETSCKLKDCRAVKFQQER